VAALHGPNVSTLSLTAALARSSSHPLDLTSPAADRATPLEVAVGRWHADSPQYVRLLLRHGADPNRASLFPAGPPLFVAARAGKVRAPPLLCFGLLPSAEPAH
jgi:hypothetical protein